MAKKYDPQAGSLFKKRVPQMPEGYYSGDKPNPNLRAFVEQHVKERPYDPDKDEYDVDVFQSALQSTRSKAIYGLHPYHQGKKPHDSIQKYIRHYTRPGDLVLDPMCGSGSTALAALLEGCKAIAIDLSPAATFIASRYCTPVNIDKLKYAFKKVINQANSIASQLYTSTCPHCHGPAEIQYVVWSERYECLRCARVVSLYSCKTVEVEAGTYPGFERGQGRKKSVSICPLCNRQPISTRHKKQGMIPVEISVTCLNRCTKGQIVRELTDPEDLDYAKSVSPLDHVECQRRWYPTEEFSEWAKKHDGLLTRGVKTIADFFTIRNLIALAEIYHQINKLDNKEQQNALKFVFSASLMSCSKKAQHLDEGGGYIPGNWHIPPMIKERNVLNSMSRVFSRMIKGLEAINDGIQSTDLVVSTQSAVDLSEIHSNSIDYIFTDPPYGAAVQYGELNLLWESWLGFDRKWIDDEIIVNSIRGKTEYYWQQLMAQALLECYRVLKPGRAISICYHDASAGTWASLLDAAASAGFIPEQTERALTIQMQQRTFNQSTSNEVVKRDLVVTFRKPTADLSQRIYAPELEGCDAKTFSEVVTDIVSSELTERPGLTIDRLYDIVVSKLVRLGKMQKHDFRDLVERVASSTDDHPPRWFLRSQSDLLDYAETAKEDDAAKKISSFINDYMSKNPGDEGVHYSDLFEHYIYAVKDKPRRQLAEFLPDYFYKTEHGTWRLPASEEEEKAKREARVKGLGRRVKRYIAQLELGAIITEHERPNDATIAEWIRHCKRAGLYEQGKLLYEKGGLNPDNLPEEAMVGVEEDYQVCARMLAREASEPKRRGRKKAEE